MNLRKNRLSIFVWMFAMQMVIAGSVFAQADCIGLTASYTTTESRCTATGTLQINASGGSGSYNYKILGATTADFTSSSLISGLKPGTYSVIVKDIVNGCTFEIDNIIITGSYSDPRFGITETDVTCMNGNDGTISVAGLTNGRSSFVFTIVAPSASGIGTANSTGTFTGLVPGSYSIELTDSCGGIQTRNISIQNYNWSISSVTVSQNSCTSYNAQIGLTDSKGHSNSSGSFFNGYTYGYVNGPGDTLWFTTSAFDFDLAQKRTATLVVKDNCGLVQIKTWTNTVIPSVQANATLNGNTCTGFNATITGQQNLTTPIYCLTDNSGNPVTGQPCNTTGSFTNIPYGSYCIHITNSCYDTVITRCFTQAQAVPAITSAVALSNYTCTSFQAAVTGQQNLTNPQYCLLDNAGNPVTGVPCNTTGIFPNLPFGIYTIRVTDGCTGTIINLNFSGAEKIKSVATSVTTNGYTCTTFNAAITGQTNLVTPQYCLVDSVGNPVICNSTGIFNNISFGSYCIHITDACNDTTIQRCITVTRPVPTGGSASISNKTCNGFTITVTGQINIFNGLYCLQDNLGNPVAGVPCNNTGVFTNIPYGSYCVQTTDGCSGTVLTNCFTVTAPVIGVGPAVISNINCTGFTATITGQQNLTNPVYCLYDSLNNPVGACNSTGIFAITGFGSYSIVTTDGCAGAVFTSNFSVNQPIPSVGPTVNFSNQSCTSFSASITGQANLTNPHYYLLDNMGDTLDNNNTGAFSNLAYGSYCIDIVNSCFDTTIIRCFSLAPVATQMTVTATPSCVFNASDLSIHVSTGFAPYTASVFNASDSLIADTSSNSNQISISGLPALAPGDQYKIIVTGTCGSPATLFVNGQQSALTHIYTITPKCPSSITPNGSGDLLVGATTNLGTLNMSIIQKDGVPDTIGYAFRSGNNFTFSNLDAATYIVAYTFSGCSTTIQDTIIIPNYIFPSLAPSGAYQCDNNSFSVGAAVSGGMGPFNFQIIGSEPSAPSINSTIQSNPVFMINNGVQYSLVRLRAIDACGNATLNDVSILPLANTIITSTSDCIYKAATLSTDLVANATYIWYKKMDMASTDSIQVGTDPTYNIPAIQVADTGIYVNRMTVNNGCLTRLSYFHLNGICNDIVLLAPLTLQGSMLSESSNQLNWSAPGGNNTINFVIERMDDNSGRFLPVGNVSAGISPSSVRYNYVDHTNGAGSYYYRLKMINQNGQETYSNVVLIQSASGRNITVFPNPVKDEFHITFPVDENNRYNLGLYNVAGQLIFSQLYDAQHGVFVYHRDPKIRTGVYFLKIVGSGNGAVKMVKLIFE
jgi:hypothetical protein